jgi:hypothetical protein
MAAVMRYWLLSFSYDYTELYRSNDIRTNYNTQAGIHSYRTTL